jgi:hypothetical protein
MKFHPQSAATRPPVAVAILFSLDGRERPRFNAMHMTPRIVVSMIVIFASSLTSGAGTPSAELQRAVAAAERARATPKGQEYQDAFNSALRDVMLSGIRDCVPINAPGVRKPPSFHCVLIVGRTGKPKWIIRDSRDPMAQCFYGKLVKMTFPQPPADNWPVTFGINMPR